MTRKSASTCDSRTRKAQHNAAEAKAKSTSSQKMDHWCCKCKQNRHLKKNCQNEIDSSGHWVLSAYSNEADKEYSWYIDSGATNHIMTGKRNLMIDFKSRDGSVTILVVIN